MEIERYEKTERKNKAPEVETPSKAGALARALRVAATVLIIGAGAVFLFQGWSGFDSVQRVLSFIGFGGLLGVSGVLCAFKLREEKGARTALILGAALIPVITSQIGALIYSLLAPTPNGPAIFILKAASYADVLLVAAVGALVVVPVAFTAFSVMARARAKIITAAYLGANAVLLLPIRTPDAVGLMALGVLAALFVVDLKFLKDETSLKNFEGRTSRLLPFLTFALLIGRNLTMYDPSAMLFSAIFAAVGGALFIAFPRYLVSAEATSLSQTLGSVFLCASWSCLVYAGFDAVLNGALLVTSSKYFLPSVTLPMAVLLMVLSAVARSEGSGYRIVAACIAMLGCLLQITVIGGVFSSVICILVAIVLLALGQISEERITSLVGVAGLVIGLLSQLQVAIELYSMSPWVSLALIGMAVLVVSSVVERKYDTLSSYLPKLVRPFMSKR